MPKEPTDIEITRFAFVVELYKGDKPISKIEGNGRMPGHCDLAQGVGSFLVARGQEKLFDSATSFILTASIHA